MKKFIIALFMVFAATVARAACNANQIDVAGDGTNCRAAKFSVTTVANTTLLEFTITAVGTFYIDCGNGGTLESTSSDVSGKTITRSDTTGGTYTCTWGTGAVQTVKFGGTATNYNTSAYIAAISFYTNVANTQKIISVSGNMSAMFPYMNGNLVNGAQPRFFRTFYGATNLTNIDKKLFSDYTTGATDMFNDTFRGCTGLTSIPARLFSGITTSANNMFNGTFYGCTGLTSVPAELFSGITTGAIYMFGNTFYGCTGLTSIPEGLFSNVTGVAGSMFRLTFYGCTNIMGYIPKSTFAGLISAGSPAASNNMWTNTFTGTQLDSTCPNNMDEVQTPYQGTTPGTQWGNYAMCADTTCVMGKYLNGGSCKSCPENSYCLGDTAQPVACALGLYSPAGASSAAQCGRILHIGDDIVYLRADKITSPALHIDVDHDGIADYFGNMTTADVVMHAGSERKFKIKYGNTIYSVYDDTVTLPAE